MKLSLMKLLFSASIFYFISSNAVAGNLAVSFQTEGLNWKGEFSFKPENSITFSGVDEKGRKYSVEIQSKMSQKDIIEYKYFFSLNGKKMNSGAVIAQKTELAKTTTQTDGQPAMYLECKYTE